MSSPMTPSVLQPPDVTQERNAGSLMVQAAVAFVVDTADRYQEAGGRLVHVARGKAMVGEKMDPLCSLTDKAHKQATGLRKELLEPFEKSDRIYRAKMWDWENTERRRRAEEQERLEAEARKQAEDEALQRAQILEAEGQHEAAEAELSQPIVTAVVAPPPPPKVEGYSSRTVYDYEIVMASAVKPAYLSPDPKKIKAAVTAHGPDAAALVGGIRVLAVARQTVRR